MKKGRRKVTIELMIQMDIEVPSEWNSHDVNFYLNESSHCINNEVEQICKEYHDQDKDECFCSRVTAKYLREVTK